MVDVEEDLFPGYVIDTSAFIDLKPYYRETFPSLWSKLEEMVKGGKLAAPQEVLGELQQQKDELLEWAKKQKFFVELDAAQIENVKKVIENFPSLIDKNKTVAEADPFVIALAMTKGKKWAVVSSEKQRGTSSRMRIPDVCGYYSIKCFNLRDFFAKEGWKF